MKQEKIDRINALAKKSREQGLNSEELAEQKILREEYIQGFRNSLTSQLDNTYIMDEAGNKRKLGQHGEQENGA